MYSMKCKMLIFLTLCCELCMSLSFYTCSLAQKSRNHSTHHCGRGRYRRSRRLVRPGGHTDWTHLTSWFSPHLVGPGQCWWTPTTPTSTRGSRFWGTFREFFRLNWNKLAWEFENLPDWGITLLEVWKMLMFSENWLTDWRTSVSTLPSILFLSSYNWFNQLWPHLIL